MQVFSKIRATATIDEIRVLICKKILNFIENQLLNPL